MPKTMNLTRITPLYQTLIHNIFYNEVQPKIVAGNIATNIPDHLIQFIVIEYLN